MSNHADGSNASKNNQNLPQFMHENSKVNYAEIEEKPSWLNNNLHKLMVSVSAVWFAIVLIYITQFFGWSNLFLMMPDEFGGFLAGITLPLAIIWVVMAYIDRGTSFKHEAKFLRAYMNQLVYPEEGAPQTAKAMADAIRSQVIELQQVTKMATENSVRIKDEIGSNIQEFTRLVATLDNYSSTTIKEMSEGVKFLVKNLETVSEHAENSIKVVAEYNKKFVDNTADVDKNISGLLNNLSPRLKEIQASAQQIKEISAGSNHNIIRANELLMQFNDEAETNLSKVSETLSRQTSSLQEISKTAVESCQAIKSELGSQVGNLDNLVEKHVAKLDNIIEQSAAVFQDKVNRIGMHATESCNLINNNIHKEISGINTSIDAQVKKVDNAVARFEKEISGFVTRLNDGSEQVSERFSSHGQVIAREIDKLMVRTSNLEESISIQVENLHNVSEETLKVMRDVDSELESKIETLTDKSTTARVDLDNYISTIGARTIELEKLAASVAEQSAAVGEEIINRHNMLNETVTDVTGRIDNVNQILIETADNVKTQTENTISELNTVGLNMNRHAQAVTEASSIVVAQSQISEASLAQQQKNISNSVIRIEEIKSELKRQIEELATASSTLEGGALATVDKLRRQMDVMLETSENIIRKSQAINDNLTVQADQFDANANKTLAKVTQFDSVLRERSQNLEELSKVLSERSVDIDGLLGRHLQAIETGTSSSREAIQKASGEFEKQNRILTEIAKDTVSHVYDVTQALDDKAAAVSLLFKQQENEFFSMCDKMAENTSVMSEALRKQIAIIEQSADKVFSRMVLLEEDTHKHAEAVVNNSHRSIEKLAKIEESLSSKNEAIGTIVNEFSQKFETLSDEVQNKIDIFDTTVQNITNETSSSTKTILGNCSKLQNVHGELSGQVSGVAKMIEEHVKNIDVAVMKTKMQAEDINQTLSRQQENLTDVANTLATQTRLGEASLAQQYKYLSDAATEVAKKVREINDTFQNNTSGIFEMSTKMAYEFDVLGDRIIKVSEDVGKSSKNSIKSVEQVNLALSQCGEDLDATIHHSVENINGVFKDYEKYIAGFNTVTAETSTGVVEINNLISEQSNKMVAISEDTKKLVECFNTVLNETSGVLSERANQAYDKVKGLGKNLKELSLQLDEAAKLSAAHLENSGDKLRATIGEIAANAERISNEIRSSGEVFLKQSNVLTASTEDTVSKVRGVMDALLHTSKEFALKGDDVIKQSLRFNDIVGDQLKLLNDNTKKADNTLNRLQKINQDVDINSFLKDASRIIEKLQTISVDVNRVFNPKDEEELWKKFYNGDSSVFVRYLAKNLTKTQMQSIRKEFEKNPDFRTLISTYLSEFEILISRAKNHEHSGVLLAVISGADIGKLYYILAKTLDKLD